jgi:hypothetical protein
MRDSTSALGVAKEGVSVSPYMSVEAQRWTIAPAGGGFYQIAQVGTGNALEVSTDGKTVDLAPFTGADAQLWTVDEFPDGSWRIRNKANGAMLGTEPKERVETGQFTGDFAHPWWILTP